MSKTRHVLRFQGCGGTLTIEADGTTYEITFENGKTSSRQDSQAFERPEAGSPEVAGNQQPDFYRDISQEMYQKLGNLVKSLSASLQSLGLDDRSNLELPVASTESQGVREDSEPEVKMTEEAPISITDIIKTVQEDCGTAREQMEAAQGLLGAAQPPAPEDWERLVASIAEAQSQLARMLDEKRALLAELEGTSAPGSDLDHTADPIGQFSLKGLFQALYEFCTNEDYKKKIKIMWERHEELFDTDSLQKGLRKGADALTADDGFYPFSISFLLSQLEDACTVPNVKNFVTVVSADAETVFIESAIPLEMLPTTEGVAHYAGVAPSSSEGVSLVSVLRGDVESMEALVTQWERPGDRDEARAEARSRDTAPVHESLEQAKGAVEKIENSLNGIVGALSSEDLSGQPLPKIAEILEGVQLDLLGIILTYNTMTTNLEEQPEVSPTRQTQVVQDEVERMLSDLRLPEEAAAAGGGERPDQGKVNELLKGLGF